MSLGSALDGDVKLPAVGSVPKKVLIPIAAAAAAFVGWRYYVARNTPADTGEDTPVSDFATDGTVPDTLGAVSSDNSYGLADSGSDTGSDSSSYGFTGTTNSQWTQYAAAQLSYADSWSNTDVLSALGAYLAGSPLTSLQIQIVQAALAVAGSPPVGNHVLVPGGNTGIIVTPSAPAVSSVTSNSAVLSTGAVPGASSYHWHVNGELHGTSSSPSGHAVKGLIPLRDYSATVMAVSSSGQKSSESGGTTFHTPGPEVTQGASGGGGKAPGRPIRPAVKDVGKTGAESTVRAVAGATSYTWFLNGKSSGNTSGPSHTISGLEPGHKYKLTVEALNGSGRSAQSAAATFTTDKK